MKRILLITDTHFWHSDMYSKFKVRPIDFEKRIYKWLAELTEDDLLIHLWDFCIWNDSEHAEKFKKTKWKKILVKWNHDWKSDKWYIENAWFDFVCKSFVNDYFWKKIQFTHIPSSDIIWDINIHWHTHWNKKGHLIEERNDLLWIWKDFKYNESYHKELALEIHWYRPITLKHFLKLNWLI